MALFVYITDECAKDIRRYALDSTIHTFKERLIKNQDSGSAFDRFPPPFLKRRIAWQYRLIVSEKKREGHLVYCFLRLFVRGGTEYNNFIQDPRNYGDQHLLPLINENIFSDWLHEQIDSEQITEKTALSENESTMLWGIGGDDDLFSDSYFIFESHDWIAAINRKDISNRLILFPDNIIRFIDRESTDFEIKIDNFYLLGKKFSEHKICFLYAICGLNDLDTFKDKYKLSAQATGIDTVNQVIRHSGRSYPSILLLDNDTWISIEENKEFNLALSPEETELLKSTTIIEQDASGFPLFINGRAGSGKSTILQYLFSDYLRFYYKHQFVDFESPIFLTYSGSLVEKSKRIVNGLLSKNYKSIDNPVEISNDVLKGAIVELLPFMLSLLPTEAKSFFDLSKFIDYSKFKKLWIQHFERDRNAFKQYGVDISWHVIRSYIKGLSVDGILDKEEYTELPRNERNVTESTFNSVYEKVWEPWYKELTNGENTDRFWDSQDLVRYIIENELVPSTRPAVFCDEVQDFTRIELEFLSKLCLYSNRKIDSINLKKVPYAFAGDPFQTLNPTGFRWEATKSNFVEKFVHSLSPELNFGNYDLNYKELSFNYRSSSSIVKFCNSIQLLRRYLFDYTMLMPQFSWQTGETTHLPAYFILDEKKENLKEILKDNNTICIVIPCVEGEESDFVKNDTFLRDVVAIDDNGIPQNVFSPMRAKGLEFPRVILYGFGEYRPQGFDTANITGYKTEIENNKDKTIHLEYFINQLYVSASRAQKRLFIIDSKEGIEKLWKVYWDSNSFDSLLQMSGVQAIWENETGTLALGTENSWSEDKEDPRKVADEYSDEGKSKRDPYFLYQAYAIYKNINEEYKSKYCKALAQFYEEKYDKAGDTYIEIKEYESALKSFWKGKLYSKISNFLRIPEIERFHSRIEIRLSNLIINPNGYSKLMPLLIELKDRTSTPDFEKAIELEKELWIYAVNEVIRKNIQPQFQNSFRDWPSILSSLEDLNRKLNINSKYLSEISFYSNDFQKTVFYCELSGETRNEYYIKAKKNVLYHLYQNGSEITEKEERRLLIDYLANDLKNNTIASQLCYVYNEAGQLKAIIAKIQSAAEAEILPVMDYFVRLSSKNGDYHTIINMLQGITDNDRSLLTIFNKYNRDITYFFVREIATSLTIPEIENRFKEVISEYLKVRFLSSPINSWKSILTPEIVGSAFERSGRDIDSLKFYEKIINGRMFSDEEKTRATVRWIIVKRKQSKREYSQGIVDVAQRHEAEANARLEKLQIDIIMEPEFPNLAGFFHVDNSIENKADTTIDSKVINTGNQESDEKFTIDVGRLKVVVNKPAHKINIENTTNSNNVNLYLKTKECKSFDCNVDFIDGSFVINEMGLTITFKDQNLTLKFLNEGKEYIIPNVS